MDQIIKNIIEETFTSKKRQRLAKAKRKKELEKDPSVKKTDVDEIVDEDGNLMTSTIPISANTSGVTVKPGHDHSRESNGMMGFGGPFGNFGRSKGGASMKMWGESDMHNALGFDDTMDDNKSYDEALQTMMKDFNLTREEAVQRLGQMGYIPTTPEEENNPEQNDEVILVENPKKFIEEYIINKLNKSRDTDIVEKDNNEDNQINPIILKQIEALKQTLKNNGLSTKQILKYLQERK